MPTQVQVPAVILAVNIKLAAAASQGVHLKVADHKLEDEWLYVVVVPSEPGTRASDHADAMARIEKELRQEGFENVLLVPAIED